MSFQDNRLFATTNTLRPLPKSIAKTPATPTTRSELQRFLVVRDKSFASWWGSLRTLCAPARLGLYLTPVRLFRDTPVARFRLAGRPLVLSVLLHIAAFLWYPHLPTWNFSKLAPVEAASAEPAKIYYRLNLADFAQKFPRVTLPGPGGRPGRGLVPERPPLLGSTATHPKITIVLRPPKTDNRKQTIYQSQSAPDLQIAMDLKLPNLIAGAAGPTRPKVHFTPNDARPVQAKNASKAVPTPEVAVNATLSTVPLSAELASSLPHLPMPPPAPAAANSGNDTVVLADGSLLSGKDPRTLIIVGIDPSSGSSSLALPPGNRWAELSISPAGGGSGSPGGVRGGAPNGGRGGPGTGSDSSAGVGRGASGGGGGETGNSAGVLTSTGTGEAGRGSSNVPDPMLPANMVYAVPPVSRPRRDALVVSAGPMGGGGLDAYGAMHCGKIYSVFLSMPGKSWTLQFCESKHEATTEPSRAQSAVVRLESGLLPPDPELKFDFRRLPLPLEKAHKVILLRGQISEDGTVSQAQVFRGLQPQMDEAARLAFLRWKFKPAIREGRPVAVEILVGIPSDPPPGTRSELPPTHAQ